MAKFDLPDPVSAAPPLPPREPEALPVSAQFPLPNPRPQPPAVPLGTYYDRSQHPVDHDIVDPTSDLGRAAKAESKVESAWDDYRRDSLAWNARDAVMRQRERAYLAETRQKAERDRINLERRKIAEQQGLETFSQDGDIHYVTDPETGKPRYKVGASGYRTISEGRDDQGWYEMRHDQRGPEFAERVDLTEYVADPERPGHIVRRKQGEKDATKWETAGTFRDFLRDPDRNRRLAAEQARDKAHYEIKKAAEDRLKGNAARAKLALSDAEQAAATRQERLAQIDTLLASDSPLAQRAKESIIDKVTGIFGETPDDMAAAQREIGQLQQERERLLAESDADYSAIEQAKQEASAASEAATLFGQLADAEGIEGALEIARERDNLKLAAQAGAEAMQRLGLADMPAAQREATREEMERIAAGPDAGAAALAREHMAIEDAAAALSPDASEADRQALQARADAWKSQAQEFDAKAQQQQEAEKAAKRQRYLDSVPKIVAARRLGRLDSNAITAPTLRDDLPIGVQQLADFGASMIGAFAPGKKEAKEAIEKIAKERRMTIKQATDAYRQQLRTDAVRDGIFKTVEEADDWISNSDARHGGIFISPITGQPEVGTAAFESPEARASLLANIENGDYKRMGVPPEAAQGIREAFDRYDAAAREATIQMALKTPDYRSFRKKFDGKGMTEDEIFAEYEKDFGWTDKLLAEVTGIGAGAVQMVTSTLAGVKMKAGDLLGGISEDEAAKIIETLVGNGIPPSGDVRSKGMIGQTIGQYGPQLVLGALMAYLVGATRGKGKLATGAASALSIGAQGLMFGMQIAADAYVDVFQQSAIRDPETGDVLNFDETHKLAMQAFDRNIALGFTEIVPVGKIFSKIPPKKLPLLLRAIAAGGTESAQEVFQQEMTGAINNAVAGTKQQRMGLDEVRDIFLGSALVAGGGLGIRATAQNREVSRAKARYAQQEAQIAATAALADSYKGSGSMGEMTAPMVQRLTKQGADQIADAKARMESAEYREDRAEAAAQLNTAIDAYDALRGHIEADAKMAEAGAEVDAYAPQGVPQAQINHVKHVARAVAKVAMDRADMMTAAEKHALETVYNRETGNFDKVTIPRVETDTGKPVIEESTRRWLTQNFPAMAKLFPKSESEVRRDNIEQQRQEEAAKAAEQSKPAEKKPAAKQDKATARERLIDILTGDAQTDQADAETITDAFLENHDLGYDMADRQQWIANTRAPFADWLRSQGGASTSSGLVNSQAANASVAAKMRQAADQVREDAKKATQRAAAANAEKSNPKQPNATDATSQPSPEPGPEPQARAGADVEAEPAPEPEAAQAQEATDEVAADATRQMVDRAVRSQKSRLDAMGVEIEVTEDALADDAPAQYEPQTNRVRVSIPGMAEFWSKRPANQAQRDVDAVIAEEAWHAIAVNAGIKDAEIASAYVEFTKANPDVAAAIGKAYSGWDQMTDRNRGHELLRMMLSFHAEGRTTEMAWADSRQLRKALRALTAQNIELRPTPKWRAILQKLIDFLTGAKFDGADQMRALARRALEFDAGLATNRPKSGDGAIAAATPARGKPRHEIIFNPPVKTKHGRIISYSWSSKLIEDIDRQGEPIDRRVSDWEQAATNAETGRQIVHQFLVENENGETTTVSLETAIGLLGTAKSGAQVKQVIAAARRLAIREQELENLIPQQEAARAAFGYADQRGWRETPPVSVRPATDGDFPHLVREGATFLYVGNDQMGAAELRKRNFDDPRRYAQSPEEVAPELLIDARKRWAINQVEAQFPESRKVSDRIKFLERTIKRDRDLVEKAASRSENPPAGRGDQPATRAMGGERAAPAGNRSTSTREEIDAAGAEAATSPENNRPEPTDAQKEAGNYKKAKVKVFGMDVTIENPRGSTRSGKARGGKEWSVEMKHDYGYFNKTRGIDGDAIDVFIGPNPESQFVFVVDQVKPTKARHFDEHKVMVGFDSAKEAMEGYLANYSPGWKGLGAMTQMERNEFLNWVKNGDPSKPVAKSVKVSPREKMKQDVAAGAKKEKRQKAAQSKQAAPKAPSRKTESIEPIKLFRGVDRSANRLETPEEAEDGIHFSKSESIASTYGDVIERTLKKGAKVLDLSAIESREDFISRFADHGISGVVFKGFGGYLMTVEDAADAWLHDKESMAGGDFTNFLGRLVKGAGVDAIIFPELGDESELSYIVLRSSALDGNTNASRPLVEPGFYSALAEAVEQKLPARSTPDQSKQAAPKAPIRIKYAPAGFEDTLDKMAVDGMPVGKIKLPPKNPDGSVNYDKDANYNGVPETIRGKNGGIYRNIVFGKFGRSPDVVAQELGFDNPDRMWEQIAEDIDRRRNKAKSDRAGEPQTYDEWAEMYGPDIVADRYGDDAMDPIRASVPRISVLERKFRDGSISQPELQELERLRDRAGQMGFDFGDARADLAAMEAERKKAADRAEIERRASRRLKAPDIEPDMFADEEGMLFASKPVIPHGVTTEDARFFVGMRDPEIQFNFTGSPQDSVAMHNAKVEVLEILARNDALTPLVTENLPDFDYAMDALAEIGDRRDLDEIADAHDDDADRDEFKTSKNLFDWVVAENGTTTNWRETGYLLPDGRQVRLTYSPNTRDKDHREVDWPGGPGGTKALISMMNAGAVRIMGGASMGGMSIRRPLTGAQESKIRDYVNRSGEIVADIESPAEDGFRESASKSFEGDDSQIDDFIDAVSAFYKKHKIPAPDARFTSNGNINASRPLVEPGFYSALAEAVDQKLPARSTPDQAKAAVRKAPGVKPEELKWVGYDGIVDRLAAENGGKVPADALAAAVREQAGAMFNVVDSRGNQEEGNQYANYQLRGGKNYREVVLAMPDKPRENFKTLHFSNVPNYVAHMRLNERADADGEPGLFIEEIQSDRHQKGRKEGYIGEFEEPKSANPRGWEQVGERGVADAPYRKDWPLAMFKRALRDAVESGKAWVGWTDGETQNDRYNLSNQVDEVKAFRRDDGSFDFMVRLKRDGRQQDINSVAPSKLAETIGKELAEKVAAQPSGWQTYSGVDLKVGGKGMRGFYDGMLPKEVAKYVKQWGGKVVKSRINIPPIMVIEVKAKRSDERDGAYTLSLKTGRTKNDKTYVLLNIDQEKLSGIVGADLSDRITNQQGRDWHTYNDADFPIPEGLQGPTIPEDLQDQRQLAVRPIWRVEITPEMRAGVSDGQALFASKPAQSSMAVRATMDLAKFNPEGLFGTTLGEAEKAMVRIVTSDWRITEPHVVRVVPLAALTPIQFGDDYINPSSRETARLIREGKAIDRRWQDVMPILANADGTIKDGHHRHAAAAMNGDDFIAAVVPVNSDLANYPPLFASKPQAFASQRQADAAAREAGYRVTGVYHFTDAPEFETWDFAESPIAYFAGGKNAEAYASEFGKRPIRAALKADKPLDLRGMGLREITPDQFTKAMAAKGVTFSKRTAEALDRAFAPSQRYAPWFFVRRLATDGNIVGDIRRAGFDSIRQMEDNPRPRGNQIASVWGVFAPEQIKSAALDTGVPAGERFDAASDSMLRASKPVTPEQDAEYMAAVGRGDMDAAQRMVDAAADAIPFTVKPPKKLWRGEGESGGLGTFMLGAGRYSTPEKSTAAQYGNVAEVPINDYWPRNPLVLNGVGPASGLLDLYIARNTEFRNQREFHKTFPDPADWIKSLGFDGVVASDEVVRFTADPVTRDAAGDVIPLSQRFNPDSDSILYASKPVTAEQDAEYMAAVERGDMDAAQRMVDAAAKAAGYEIGPVWHTTNKDFDAFNPGERRMMYFNRNRSASSAATLSSGGNRSLAFYLKSTNPANTEDSPIYYRDVEVHRMGKAPESQDHLFYAAQSFIEDGQNPFTGLKTAYPDADYADIEASIAAARGERKPKRKTETIFEVTGADLAYVSDEGGVSIAVPNPNQIKSADPVTRDESGNVIPLSERFNPDSNSILYASKPGDPGILNRGATTAVRAVADAAKGASDAAGITRVAKAFIGTGTGQAIKGTAEKIASQLAPWWTLPREFTAMLTEQKAKQNFEKNKFLEMSRVLRGKGEAEMSGIHIPPELATQQNREAMGRVLDGKAPIASLPDALQTTVQKLRDEMDRQARRLLELGMMSPETYEVNRDRGYFPRYYLENERAETPWARMSRKLKMGLGWANPQLTSAFFVYRDAKPREAGAVDYGGRKIIIMKPPGQDTFRFGSEQQRDAYFEELVQQEVYDDMRAEGYTVTRDQMASPEMMTGEARGFYRKSMQDQRAKYQKGKPLNDEELEKLKLIYDVAYSVPKRLISMSHDIALAELFNRMAQRQEWFGTAADAANKTHRQIPDVAGFGAIRGKYLQNNIADQVQEMVDMPDMAMALYDEALRMWKAGKTIANPATHGRNVLGNIPFSILAGNNAMDPRNAKYYRAAVKLAIAGPGGLSRKMTQRLVGDAKIPKGVTREELFKIGLLGGDFDSAELRSMVESLDLPPEMPQGAEELPTNLVGRSRRARALAAKGGREAWRKIQTLYRLEDDFYKIAAYLKYRESGMSQEAAVTEIRKWFPFYDQIGNSGTLKFMRRFPFPFLSFLHETVRIMGAAAKEKPVTMAAMMMLPALLTQLSFRALGLNDEDEDEVMKDLRGKDRLFGAQPIASVVLPFADKNGMPMQWDLTATLPWGSMVAKRYEDIGADDNPLEDLAKVALQNPAASLAASIAQNKDTFSGRPIKETGMTGGEKAKAYFDFIARQLLPPITPGVGSADPLEIAFGADRKGRFLQERNKAQEAVRKLGGIDTRSAAPDPYRMAYEYAQKIGLPPQGEHFDTTPRSRSVRRLYAAMVAEDYKTMSEELAYLRDEHNLDIRTRADIEGVIRSKNPLYAIPRKSEWRPFLNQLPAISRKVVDGAVSEYEKLLRRAPTMLVRARSEMPPPKPKPRRFSAASLN